MMLLDTHTALWLRAGDARLGPVARAEIQRAWESDAVALSAISFWEIAMLRDKDRIRYPVDVELWRREFLAQGMVEIPIDGEIAARAWGSSKTSTPTPPTASSSPPPSKATPSSPQTRQYSKGLRDALLHELLDAAASPAGTQNGRKPPCIGTRCPASWDVVRLGDVAEISDGPIWNPATGSAIF